MPKSYRISKRGKGLGHDARWKHFQTEQMRKQKKLLKKGALTQTKKKLSKDPGIPNLYPYKKEILHKLLENKQDITKESVSRVMAMNFDAELQQQIAQNQLAQAHEIVQPTNEEEPEVFEKERHMRKQAFKSELMKTIDQVDVMLEVLDARDPENTRNAEAEQYCLSKQKPFILMLNKIDLVPAQVIQQWLQYYKQINIPVICFKCPQTVTKGSVRYANAATGISDKSACVGSFELKHLLNKLTQGKKVTAACVGYPNTGKSSVINALANRPACQTAPIPGMTRTVQEIHIDTRIRILDSPGVVYDIKNSVVLREEQLIDPVGEVGRIFQMIKDCQQIYSSYELQIDPSLTQIEDLLQDFLVKLGKKHGRVRQGGIVDQEQIAREVIRDWNRGQLAFWRTPQQSEHVQQLQGTWNGFDADMINKYNIDVLGHLASTQYGLELK